MFIAYYVKSNQVAKSYIDFNSFFEMTMIEMAMDIMYVTVLLAAFVDL